MSSCFWFGHSPSHNEAVLEEAIRSDRFKCRRCSEWVLWKSMHPSVQAKVGLARSVLARLDRATKAAGGAS